MESKATALYDFEGDAATGELSFAVGEVIVITNKDVDEGWWEGKKSDGIVGLFPLAYVQEEESSSTQDSSFHDEAELSFSQDPFQQGNVEATFQDDSVNQEQMGMPFNQDPFQQTEAAFSQDPFQIDSSQSAFAQDPFQQGSTEMPFTPNSQPISNETNDDPFGDFPSSLVQNAPQSTDSNQQNLFDDESGYLEVTDNSWAASPPVPTSPPVPNSPPQTSPTTPSQPSPTSDAPSPIKRTNTFKMSIFSSISKSAGKSFVVGESKVDVSNSRISPIVMGPDGPMWQNVTNVFSCMIANPQKETKYKIKNYIAYEVTPTTTSKTVSRRYKHFDWLYEQLQRKYGIAISVPPLPGKQITGRYEDDFVEGRRAQLEAWLNRMGMHPVISQAKVLKHFLTYYRNEKDWKAGKRLAEKDDVIGAAFLETVSAPTHHLELHLAEMTLDNHSKFTRSMDDACKSLINVGLEHTKSLLLRHKETERLAHSFNSLSEAFSLDDRDVSSPLTQAIKKTGLCYEAIATLYHDQSYCDWNPFLTGLNEYKAVLSTFPAILANQKNAIDKNKEVQKMYADSKVTQDDMKNAATRTEKFSFAVQSEMNHFQHYRVGDFAGYMKGFLEQQIAFHQNIIGKLEESLVDYKQMVG